MIRSDRLPKNNSGSEPERAHMTWASRTLSSGMSRTGSFLKHRIWLWPTLAVALLSLVGWLVNSAIESTIKATLASQLETLRDVEVAMLENWLRAQERNAESVANDREVRGEIESLVTQLDLRRALASSAPSDPSDTDDSLKAVAEMEENAVRDRRASLTPIEPLRGELNRRLLPVMNSFFYQGFVIADRNLNVIAASESSMIGASLPEGLGSAAQKAVDGTATVSPPFRSSAPLKDSVGRVRTGVPTMFAVAPIRDDDFQVNCRSRLSNSPGWWGRVYQIASARSGSVCRARLTRSAPMERCCRRVALTMTSF